MCDKTHYEMLENRVIDLEKKYDVHLSVSNEQIKSLFESVRRLFWIVIVFTGLLLLTVIYGAVGERGFKHISCTAKEFAPTP